MMKNKILKSIIGVAMVTIMMVTFTMNSSSVEGDIDLDNLVALNTAQAESGGWCLTCTTDILYICYSDWINGTYYGKFVSLVPGSC